MTARLNFSADFYDRGGWGRHARGLGGALTRRAHVALCNSNRDVREDHGPDGDVVLEYAAAPLADAAGVALGSVGTLPRAFGTPYAIATVWETSRVPAPYATALREADALWVPTEWGRSIFLEAGFDPARVRVVPEGVDAELFRPAEEPRARDVFRFLCVGKWEPRKGVAQLVR